jgi:hypothetical protein
MKCLPTLALLTLMLGYSLLLAQQITKVPVIDVQEPLIIAFYPPESKADADANANESLSDFQLYADKVKRPLRKIGVTFQVLYGRSFRIRGDTGTTTFRPKADVGYYLAAPGKKPQIEYGVLTDSDLLLIARRYFGFIGLQN